MKDYYKTLGVDKNASQDEIKKAFRTLAHKHHPDKGGDEKKFKEASEASPVLTAMKGISFSLGSPAELLIIDPLGRRLGKDPTKDSALVNSLIKTTDTQGKFSFGVSSITYPLMLIESVRETIADQSKRVCIAEAVSPRDFVNGIASKEVSKITLTVRNTSSGILVKKTAGSNSQTLDY